MEDRVRLDPWGHGGRTTRGLYLQGPGLAGWRVEQMPWLGIRTLEMIQAVTWGGMMLDSDSLCLHHFDRWEQVVLCKCESYKTNTETRAHTRKKKQTRFFINLMVLC